MAGPNPVAFTADPDLASQQMAAQRQQALAAMLMQDANTPLATNQMAGRYVVPVSPFQAFAKMGQAALAGYGANKADAKQLELAKLLQQKQDAAMQSFPRAQSMELAGPTPEGGNIPPVTMQPTPDQYIRWAQANPTSPMAAEVLKGAMGAQFKSMEGFNLRPNEIRYQPGQGVVATNPGEETFGNAPQFDKNGPYVVGSRGTVRRLSNIEGRAPNVDFAPNGQAVDKANMPVGGFYGDPNKPFTVGPNGVTPNQPYQDYERGLRIAGKPDVNVQVTQSTEKSYLSNLAEGLAKSDVEAITNARAAPDQIRMSDRILETLQKSPITGTGAGARLAVEKALATAGIIDPGNVNATQALMSDLANLTLTNIKGSGLGAGQGFTDKDLKFLQDAKSGNIEMTAENIRRAAELNRRSGELTIQRGNSVMRRVRGMKGMGEVAGQLEEIQVPGVANLRVSPTAQKYLDMVNGTNPRP